MAIGVRVAAAMEERLDAVAKRLGKSRSACIREAIDHYLMRQADSDEARRQSEHIAQLEQTHWSEQVPNWSGWTA
jgi:predicted DNA-binding protein